MIEKGFYSLLSGTGGVTALVDTRIFPNKAPDTSDVPYVVYARLSNDRRRCLAAPSPTKRATLQVSCVGSDYTSAKALASEVTDAIGDDSYYTGTWDSLRVIGAYWDNDADDFTPPQDKSDNGTHEINLTLVVWYQTS